MQRRIIQNLKYHCNLFEFLGKFLTSLTKLVLEPKAITCCAVKGNIFLYCRMFSAFDFLIKIVNRKLARSVSQRNAAYNTNHLLCS